MITDLKVVDAFGWKIDRKLFESKFYDSDMFYNFLKQYRLHHTFFTIFFNEYVYLIITNTHIIDLLNCSDNLRNDIIKLRSLMDNNGFELKDISTLIDIAF